MSCSSVHVSNDPSAYGETASLENVKLNESTYLAAAMPKKEIGADRFLKKYPNYDGRGVVVAVFDSGVDPAAAGLQVTSDGKPKILDIIDCTGGGDIDTSKVVKADADGCICGVTGSTLVLNSSWKNPSGEWRVGYKLVYELFTDDLASRVKKEGKKKWDDINQEAISKAVALLDEFDKKYDEVKVAKLKLVREDLKGRINFLQKQAENYDDKGPIIDAVVWHDGEHWRVALDTQGLQDGNEGGKLVDFVPLANYKIERKFGVFSNLDTCSFVVNVYDEGNTLSIVTDSSPHGTHVSGIAAAFHEKEPLLNGVAPGAQIVSCKIGDSRLGSMETGTGLTRALIAVVEHKCDLINMSYGEPILLPNYGRFVDLVNEVVDKQHVVFISSVSNSGPGLSTVGAPGGTTSSIIGVGAYVSPAMAAGAHSVVQTPHEGLEYTWSSRGPTTDGDLGVCISAPGGAVAPVPTWTLQRRMLMNGTSMASPSACGGVALIMSAMKAEGIAISPYSIRRALENTCTQLSEIPHDKLSVGNGLMQVDKAYEYIQKNQNYPLIRYQIKVDQVGKSSPTFRGIYLREASACQQITEWTVQVEPMFHEDAGKLDELVPFEEHIELHSSENAVVTVPDFLLLTNHGRTFKIVTNPTKLVDGLHYYEVYGLDCNAPWRGPLFRIPVIITKPLTVRDQLQQVSFRRMKFSPGHIERRFVEVPFGATWVDLSIQISGFDTAQTFFIDAIQIHPLKRPIMWEKVVTFTSAASKTFSFPAFGGCTMELAIAQFWSSGLGSHMAPIINLEVGFHGISAIDKVVLDGSEAPVRIALEALLSSEKLHPIASLDTIRIPYCPSESKLTALSSARDRLPSGKQILALTLTYKFKLEDGAEIKPNIPLLNNRIYDTKFESQFYMIYDINKRVHGVGDVYPKSLKLTKGEYLLQLYLRHDNIDALDKMKQMTLFIERHLDRKDVIPLKFFSAPDGPVMGNEEFTSSMLVPCLKEAVFVGPPSKEKLPKNIPEGSVLLGTISYGLPSIVDEGVEMKPWERPAYYQILYIMPPIKDVVKQDSSPINKKCVSERLEEEVRDTKVKFLFNLKQGNEEERYEWEDLSNKLRSEYPKYTPLLAKILEGLLSQNGCDDKIVHYKKIINAADEVICSIDRDELAKYFSFNSDPEDDQSEAIKKKMETTRDQLAEALLQKGLSLAELEGMGTSDGFEENFKEIRKWVNIKSSKYGILFVIREKRCGRLGTALVALDAVIKDAGDPPKKKHYELKSLLLDEIGWDHLASYERRWMFVRFPPSLPLF